MVAARLVFAGFGAPNDAEKRGGAKVYAAWRNEYLGRKFQRQLKHLSRLRGRCAA
jgi:hypothetical protein